jgi:hypothetical protein
LDAKCIFELYNYPFRGEIVRIEEVSLVLRLFEKDGYLFLDSYLLVSEATMNCFHIFNNELEKENYSIFLERTYLEIYRNSLFLTGDYDATVLFLLFYAGTSSE